MGPAALNINDALPEEALCLILGAVDFASKAAVLRTCKKWYKLLTYPPQVSTGHPLPPGIVVRHCGGI